MSEASRCVGWQILLQHLLSAVTAFVAVTALQVQTIVVDGLEAFAAAGLGYPKSLRLRRGMGVGVGVHLPSKVNSSTFCQ